MLKFYKSQGQRVTDTDELCRAFECRKPALIRNLLTLADRPEFEVHFKAFHTDKSRASVHAYYTCTPLGALKLLSMQRKIGGDLRDKITKQLLAEFKANY